MIAAFNQAHRGYVEVEAFGPVLEIRMTKPKVNAICRRLSRALGAALDVLQDDDGFRVGILASASSRAFSAGWDFNEAIAVVWGKAGGFGIEDDFPDHGLVFSFSVSTKALTSASMVSRGRAVSKR